VGEVEGMAECKGIGSAGDGGLGVGYFVLGYADVLGARQGLWNRGEVHNEIQWSAKVLRSPDDEVQC
jgi:hypothetical protein